MSASRPGSRYSVPATNDPIADVEQMCEKPCVKTFLLIRRFVDWDLRRRPLTSAGNLTLLVGMVPWLALLLFDDRATKNGLSVTVIVIIVLDLIWLGFVAWRAWLMLRSSAEKADRHYDRHGKYILHPEYAETESATEARRRRSNGN
jgi:hypothetical protein